MYRTCTRSCVHGGENSAVAHHPFEAMTERRRRTRALVGLSSHFGCWATRYLEYTRQSADELSEAFSGETTE